MVAIRTAVITRKEARERYLLSEEELRGWEAAFDRTGIPGLRSGVQQPYRPSKSVPAPLSPELG